MVRQDMDGEISARLMKLAGKHPLLDRFWVFSARYLIVLLGLAVLVVLWQMRGVDDVGAARAALLTVGAVVAAETASWGIAYVHFRSRPFVANHLTPLVRIASGMKSFPSDHATISFSLATALLFYAPTWAAPAYPIAAVLSAARVVCGVHYPSDVLAGAALGTLVTSGVFFASRTGLF